MSALALVPDDMADDTTEATGRDVAITDPGDLYDSPHLDCEAQALCALLWATTGTAQQVVEHLRPSDFARPVYAELYTAIARQVRRGQPHTSVLVLAALERDGRVHSQLSTALVNVTLADARDHEAGHLAHAVIAAAYRRGYTSAATALGQLAEQAPTADLYEQMCELGRERRDAQARLTAAADALT